MGLMGVLPEIGTMRCVVVVLLSVSAWRGCAEAACPSLCSCRGGKPEAGAGEPPPGEPLRLRCGPSPVQITELKEIDFINISTSVVSLNMSGNAISTVSRDLHLPNLQKLDLSRNQISLLESDAFYNVSALQRLDLSHNQIAAVSRDLFKGLASLERLLLAHNLLTALPPGVFDHLVALKLLDIAENPLECGCGLAWVGGWLHATGVRLAGTPRCAAPDPLAGRPVRKLRTYLDPAQCGAAPEPLVLRPARDQLVFEGDALALACAAPAASAAHPYRLRWAHPALEACDVNVTSTDVAEEGVAEVVAWLPNVTQHHAGEWSCVYSDERRVRHERTLALVVVGNATRSCPTNVTADNKGLYSWPQLLLNRTAEVPCRAGAAGARASRRCGADGAWEPADTEQCAYIANVTKLLQQFALLDVGLVQYSALNATARLAALLRENTYPLAEIRDPDDVMFVARAVRNYMRYIPDEKDLGSALLDVISAAMNVTPAVMAAAEARYGACSQLVRAAEELARIPSDKQKSNFAVESFPVRAGWGGATCVWYSAGGQGQGQGQGQGPGDADPRLHCTTTNRTVARLLTFSDAQVHASVQIPASLVFALQGAAAELVVGVFRDAALFPLLPEDAPGDAHRAKDYYGRSTKREDLNMEITSPVISVRLVNGSLAGELLEPVVGTLRAVGCGSSARAAVWDPGDRRWQRNTTKCRVLHYAGCTAVVGLAGEGACALLARAERGIFGARTHGARFKPSHPAVYVGSLALGACLAAAATTYAAAFPALHMPRRAKHAHLNTWLALGALCLLYTLGVYQTEDAALCRALGLAIHYLSLSALLWMCVAAHVLYRGVTRPPGACACAREPAEPAPDEPPPGARPVLGLYLAGWGIALIVVGISGAVNLQEYAGYAQCFLSSAAALGALFVPGALLLLFAAALLLLTRCAARGRGATTRLSQGTQATEHVDLELWEPPPPAAAAAAAPTPDDDASSVSSDAEHAPLVQLRAQAAVLALYLATWASAAVAVYRPLPAYLPYQEDICSILYAVCATVLGTFILFFYGIARSDVRAQWALMHCYLRKSKQCCRTRSVVDSARQSLPPPPPPPPPADDRSRSGSRSSNRTASKSNNCAAYKAGAELNGHTLPRDPLKNTNHKNNINLVVLHRQQYRSDRSVLTYPEDAGADAFYNPNQMNVAKKFFKRQRQHVRRNRLELPPRRDLDAESHRSLPLPAREACIVTAGSKVNNTNIHVDRGGGVKQARRAPDPNLLDDEDDGDHKTYCTDPRPVVNIYTNVGAALPPPVSAGAGDTRTVSAQCSLDYSSSEPAPRSCSTHTLDTPSELTELATPERSAPADCLTTDTDSFGRYVQCRRPAPAPAPGPADTDDDKDKSLRDISEEGTTGASEGAPPPGETDALLRREGDADADADGDACSTNASEQGFENESDIYCPNYQQSEVSIRSHGLYAPSPASMCAPELALSAEDVSRAPERRRYVNAWRAPDPDPDPDPDSELDELYTRITDRAAPSASPHLNLTASDVTLRPDSDSDQDHPRAETAV